MSATNFFHCCANCGSAEDVSAGTTRCPGCGAPITPDEMDINAFTDLQEDLRNAYRAAEKHTQRALLLRVLKWLGDGPTALQLNETGIEEWLPKSDYDTLFQRYADVCADLALARGPTNYTDEWLEKVVDLIRAFAGNQADDIPDDLWACLRNRPANSTPAPVALGGEKGEAVAETENALRPDHPLAKGSCVHGESMAKHCAWCSARPVGKARMLTDLEITRCWEATFGYLELGIAIQHKFCEKNGIEVLS